MITAQRDIVLLVLRDQEGRFLLQHRDDDAPTYPGCWGLFGGGIEEGESPDEAIRREAYEELRYAVRVTEPVLVLPYHDKITGRHGTKFCYCELCPPDAELEQHEGQTMQWFWSDEIEDLEMTQNCRSILARLNGNSH